MRIVFAGLAVAGAVLLFPTVPVLLALWAWDGVRARVARRRTMLHGTTTAPGGGTVRAPLSGDEVAWYRLVLLRTGASAAGTGTRLTPDTLWTLISADAVGMDDGSGQAVEVAVPLLESPLTGGDRLIRRAGTSAPADGAAARAIVPEPLLTAGGDLDLMEDVVPAGLPITAVGRLRTRDGRKVVGPGWGPVYGVARQPPDALLADLRPARDRVPAVLATALVGVLLLIGGVVGLAV